MICMNSVSLFLLEISFEFSSGGHWHCQGLTIVKVKQVAKTSQESFPWKDSSKLPLIMGYLKGQWLFLFFPHVSETLHGWKFSLMSTLALFNTTREFMVCLLPVYLKLSQRGCNFLSWNRIHLFCNCRKLSGLPGVVGHQWIGLRDKSYDSVFHRSASQLINYSSPD